MRKLDIREELTHIASRDHHLQMGMTAADLITDITVEIRQDSAAYFEREPGDRRDKDGALVERRIRLQNASTTTAFFLQEEWRRWAPRLLLLPGVRLDYSTFTREWVLSPRLGLRHALTSDLTGRAGWGFYHQAPSFAGLFERFEREIEWNLFETIVLKTERARHFTAGLEWDRGQAHAARLEGYYKRLDHLVVARDSTYQSIPDNSGWGHASRPIWKSSTPSTAATSSSTTGTRSTGAWSATCCRSCLFSGCALGTERSGQWGGPAAGRPKPYLPGRGRRAPARSARRDCVTSDR